MDASKLAQCMLEWEDAARKLRVLEEIIEAAVLELGKTQTVGNVRATYSQGRRTFHYDEAIASALVKGEIADADLVPYERVVLDHKAACEGLNIVPDYSQGGPSVKVKLLS